MNNRYLLLPLFLLIFSLQLSAQNFTISGTVTTNSGKAVSRANIALMNTRYATTCDTAGVFTLKNIGQGNYTLTVSAIGFKSITRDIHIQFNQTINLSMEETIDQLKDVTVKDQRQKTFGITRLKAVEGTTINAGKKSEVIVMDDVTANKATNNTRQIYAKVSGLNIWESDGAGIQLGIGGRGLNPNRVTNFNTRQNGYDISADALGYPESYYTPPAEMTDRIELLHGASSLQYGPQFGGLINFKLKEAPDKPFEVILNQTAGSYNFLNTSGSIGGTNNKLKYYTFFQHKQGDSWRPNGHFNVNTSYTTITYKVTDKLSMTAEYTYMDYLAHQSGGLTDNEFYTDPSQSIRARNWFKVNWNLGAYIFDYRINDNLHFNSRFFGLIASRDAVGDLEYINRTDNGADRNLYRDKYTNYGNESRLLYTYKINNQAQNLLVGFRYYHGHTDRRQGLGNNGSTGNASDFEYGTSATDADAFSQYNFPNYNMALFAENIFRITPRFSIIPGARFENIITKADGNYIATNSDMAGNVIYREDEHAVRNSERHFLIAGLGLSYYQNEGMQFYANVSQNYRAINFNDLNSSIKGLVVDPNLQDETGYSADIGMRGNTSDVFNYDISLFDIYYNNRIGNIQAADSSFNTYRYRTNIGHSSNLGLESFAELEVLHFFHSKPTKTKLSVFANLALINAKYIHTPEHAYDNNRVEFAPDMIFKTGLTYRYKKLSATYQYAYTSMQFGDASNAKDASANAIVGIIPAYTVMDLSLDYKLNKTFSILGSINNLADARYFTRRAESYPGPGIIPADPRSYFITLQVRL